MSAAKPPPAPVGAHLARLLRAISRNEIPLFWGSPRSLEERPHPKPLRARTRALGNGAACSRPLNRRWHSEQIAMLIVDPRFVADLKADIGHDFPQPWRISLGGTGGKISKKPGFWPRRTICSK